MKKIDSFTVNHIKLKKGVYVSRMDHYGAETLTTFDVRMKLPNSDMLENGSIHTLEHLIATFVRNDAEFKSSIAYFGPMGCLTGMYLIVNGAYTSEQILPLLIRAFEFVSTFEGEIPGASEIECGNYKLHNLEGAKQEALAYLDVLKNATTENLIYPQ
ncbi:S-ribosylhomocysteine lyase [Fusibacter sp. 3D3]|uniref:S-ribosylhomocysteine lyase n=1 Tax=Fusibacter sp. 3D3 TaxID=1048380 RepID=UPI000852C42F|nr:S-ribosylhomocysteine lyase [Fusibacter sp. 3D3]GAU78183.1 S-ribosylhomocysteine lyase [Fusibacter sp. 3D3]